MTAAAVSTAPVSVDPEADATANDIVVTGTRSEGQRASDSIVPVTILDSEELSRDGRAELGNVLSN